MNVYLKLYGWVLLISFAGSLPPGTLNANIANLAISMGFSEAVQFGLAAILLYGLAGNLFVTFLMGQQSRINWAVGLAFLIAGVIQVFKTWRSYRSTSSS